MTQRLGIQPTETQVKGTVLKPAAKISPTAALHGWFLCSKGLVDSRDIRNHLHWLLQQLSDKSVELNRLRQENCRMWISCYWLSKDGQGGPILCPELMGQMSQLGLEIGFDCY
ncbi:MAG: DUF4279 domain-containing protein [Planctomycetia bacterium]|nr:DUF4279 domain-containing protein [Planctomycetia bacterium]